MVWSSFNKQLTTKTASPQLLKCLLSRKTTFVCQAGCHDSVCEGPQKVTETAMNSQTKSSNFQMKIVVVSLTSCFLPIHLFVSFLMLAIQRRRFTTYEEYAEDLDKKIDKMIEDILSNGRESIHRRCHFLSALTSAGVILTFLFSFFVDVWHLEISCRATSKNRGMPRTRLWSFG